MSLTVFLADGQALVRDGLKPQAGLQVVGEGTDGWEAGRQVARLHPRLSSLDIARPELNGSVAGHPIREARAWQSNSLISKVNDSPGTCQDFLTDREDIFS